MDATSMPMDYFWTFDKVYGLYAEGVVTTDKKCYNYIECRLWFQLGKSMWKKHHRVFDDHVRYFTNDIRNNFKVKILHFYEHVYEIFDLAYYLSLTNKNGEE